MVGPIECASNTKTMTSWYRTFMWLWLGFKADDYEELAKGIRSILSGDAEAVEAAKFGTKYVVRGVLAGPDGRSAAIVTVWIILSGTTTPRFVTAYPED